MLHEVAAVHAALVRQELRSGGRPDDWECKQAWVLSTVADVHTAVNFSIFPSTRSRVGYPTLPYAPYGKSYRK